jgi:hypothetical protein
VQRQGSLFLGVLLIGLGGIFLLRALDVWPDDVSTWPGILIVLGFAIALDELFSEGRISWFAPVVLVGLGVFFLLRDIDVVDSDFIVPSILIGAGLLILVSSTRRRTVETDVIDVPLDGASRARVRIEHGGGELRVGGLPAGSSSLATGRAGRVEVRQMRSGDRLDVTLRQTPKSLPRSIGREFRVDFNPNVELELHLRTGASESKLDLTNLLVVSLDLKTGASSTVIHSPQRGQTTASVDAGAASVEFRVPSNVAARISSDTGLAEVKVDTGRFPPAGRGYESPDYAVATARLDLRIKGGLGSFTVS